MQTTQKGCGNFKKFSNLLILSLANIQQRTQNNHFPCKENKLAQKMSVF